MYGMPAFSAELEQALERGELAIGGCVVTQGQPEFSCNACGHEFRRDWKPGDDVAVRDEEWP
jgi:hypothetical protein